MMRRHGLDQRALERIEQSLVASDPRLASMFAIFATMTRYEPMPVTERVPSRLSRWLHAASVTFGLYLFTPLYPIGTQAV